VQHTLTRVFEMSKITAFMKSLIENNSVGFYATVDESGSPCVSPKGTSVVVDDETIIFGNIRSPKTVANIQSNPDREVNFLNVLSRRGFRAKGRASYAERNTTKFESMISYFDKWGDLAEKIEGIVVLKVASASALSSPIYDVGVKEAELRVQWRQHYQNQ
jgi:uncharacterized protein